MEIDRKSRRQLRLQTASFVVLFLAVVGLLGWLSTRYVYEADWTASGRHTLSEASVRLLASLDGPVRITAFARDSEVSGLRERIRRLIERYQRHKADVTLAFVDPDLEPERVRTQGVTLDGELVLEYGGRRENLKSIGEQALTNALQRLARSGERRILFLQGHGERRPAGQANHDLGEWVAQLEEQGFKADTLSLTEQPAIPEDTAVLVIASPASDYLPGEVELIRRHIEAGGNLLWLADPGPLYGLEPLAAALGVEFQPGTVVDPTGQLLGIDHAAFVVVAQYPLHPVSEELTTLTLFPFVRPLTGTGEQWEHEPLLRTLPRAWSETGKLEGAVAFDAGQDLEGPLTIGLLMSRSLAEEETAAEQATESDGQNGGRTQRVAVLGDGDFLANAYLGNGANIELGNRLINWLSHDDSFIAIPPQTAPDIHLSLTPLLSALLGFGFLLLLPGGLIGTGVFIWWRRRKR